MGVPCDGPSGDPGIKIWDDLEETKQFFEDSMDWLKGNFTGNHRIDHKKMWVFWQILPFNQFLDREIR